MENNALKDVLTKTRYLLGKRYKLKIGTKEEYISYFEGEYIYSTEFDRKTFLTYSGMVTFLIDIWV